ncbi:MAG: N-acetyltransferase 10, partial [Olpidium bornovanus]
MVRKTLDSRIHTLVRNGVQSRHRSIFVVVGDRGKDQVVNLHWLLSQAQVAARPSPNTEDPFELFVSVTNIRYCYYKESHKILGNTYGMCVLQDFEALTPNLLARTIETVDGGGIVVILLRTIKSLKQLYTMTMVCPGARANGQRAEKVDVHARYRTEAHNDVVARFNERFILSLSTCETCLVVDDELNPAVRRFSAFADITGKELELKELKESLAGTEPIGLLVGCAKSLDQAKALLTFVDAISEKTLKSIVTLTAARGRGKSAALGVAIAAAVAHGYANIFVTSPSPENLKTLFEFVFKGFDALKYEEHLDYDIVQSTNPEFNKAVVRVNVFRQHRQTIQYIQPQDAHVLGQAELVVIDEAAAIPLPIVKGLLGSYLVFMASTVNGYEGTGRSLSLKLIQQLRDRSRGFVGRGPSRVETEGGVVVGRDAKPRRANEAVGGDAGGAAAGGRVLREIKLDEPIRYNEGDHVERWLNKLLCLDCSTGPTLSSQLAGCPCPSACELYHVNRDTLFSYHPVSEAFLQRMMALYVASHYKNTPDDLQLLSDAPAHHLFVLLPPIKEGDTALPEPLCVIQVALEGMISKESIIKSLSRGQRSSGDLIPWLISQQFQDNDF